MTQKELKEKYMNIIRTEVWKGSEHMIKYADKKVQYIVELDNGDITDLDKPSIETRFCFGYGYCGISDDEDYRDAADMADYAKKHDEYFLEENLKGLNNVIEELSDPSNKVYKRIKYNGQKSGSKLKEIEIAGRFHDMEYEPWRFSNMIDVEELTEQERKNVIAGYEEVKKAFTKRLNTYLKKYGLTKIHTWTYLSD